MTLAIVLLLSFIGVALFYSKSLLSFTEAACMCIEKKILLTAWRKNKKIHLQHLQHNNGNTTAAVIPIKDRKQVTEKYNGLEELPQWQKKIVDQRLDFVKNHPDQLVPLEQLLKKLDIDDTL